MRTKERYLTSSTKLDQIHVKIWLPDSEPSILLQISHGMIEHIERYNDFARFLCDNGIGVIGHDHLGHGRSVSGTSQLGYFAARGGDRALVNDIRKVASFAHREFPSARLFLFGHSMGSFLVRRTIADSSSAWAGVIICGTGYYSRKTAGAGLLLASIIRIVRGDFYRSPLLHQMVIGSLMKEFTREACPSWQTADPVQADLYHQDPLCGFMFTASAYCDFFRVLWDISTPKAAASIHKTLPILLTSGDRDPVGDFGKGVLKLYDDYKTAGIRYLSVKLYPGDRHEILNELDRPMVYRDLLNWILEADALSASQKSRKNNTRKERKK